jgi:hypothetical protein
MHVAERPVFEQIANINDAFDMIDLPAIHRQPGIFRFDHRVANGFERRAGFDRNDIGSRRHDFDGGSGAKPDDRLNEFALALFDDPFLLADVEQGLQLVFSIVELGLFHFFFGFRRRIALKEAEPAQDRVGHKAQRRFDQPQQGTQPEQRSRRFVLRQGVGQNLTKQDHGQNHPAEGQRQEMIRADAKRKGIDQDGDRSDRKMNPKG